MAAAGATAHGSPGIGGGELAADLPTALEVTSKGLMCGGSGMTTDGADAGADCSGTVGVSGADVVEVRGDRGGPEGGEPKTSGRRTIEDIFRTVDLDASGHVSQEELLEAVSVGYEGISAAA